MTKVLILYYSAYGHMERMAQAVAEGVRDAGVEADIKRVPELVSWPITTRSFLGPGLGSEFSPRRCEIFLIRPDPCG